MKRYERKIQMRHALLLAGLMTALLGSALIGQEATPDAAKETAPAPAAAPAPEKATPAPAPAEDKPVATVNGQKIMESQIAEELNKRVEVMKQRMGGQPMPESQLQMMRSRIVDMIVEQTVLEQRLKEKGQTISDEQVTAEIQKIAERQNQTMEQVEQQIKQMGMSMDDLKSQIRYKMMIDKVMEVEMKDAVKPEDVKKFYDENPQQFERPEQVKASHILVKVEPEATADAKAEAKKKAEDVLKKVKAGEDFAALAKEHSDCPSSAQGGDLGLFGRGQMVKEFEDAAFAMKPGEVSGIVETQFGYHIIKVTDKQAAGKIPFDEVKEQLEDYLKQQKQQEFWQGYREKMKADAKIEYSPEEKALREAQEQAQQQQMQQQMQQMQIQPQTAPAQPESAKPEQAKPEEGKAAEIKPKTEEKK